MKSPPTGHLREATRMVTAATSDSTFEVATPISGSASGDRWVFRIGGSAPMAGLDDESTSPQAARAASRQQRTTAHARRTARRWQAAPPR
jgi:hypothetical protein